MYYNTPFVQDCQRKYNVHAQKSNNSYFDILKLYLKYFQNHVVPPTLSLPMRNLKMPILILWQITTRP